jgi:hypothetical protein
VKKNLLFSLLTAGLVLCMASPAVAQVTQTGTVVGTVTDETGGALPGVTISIAGPSMITKDLQVYTNERGTFRIPAVPPGRDYNVTASLSGFQTISKTDIWVRVGQATKVDFQLTIAKMEEEMTVLGEAPVVDVEKTDLGENLDSQFIQNLPTSRSYQGVLLLIPGISSDPNSGAGGNYNVHGGSVRDNAYLIDGVNTTDPATGTFATNFNFDAIEEMEVKTGGYEAEFGQASGAVVNIVTKSGGNDFSGELNMYTIQDALNSPRTDPETGEKYDDTLEWEEYEPSANIGGPIARDRVWFFGSYAYTYQNRTFQENQSIPRNWRGHLFMAKGTFQLNEENKLVVQYQGDPTQITNLSQSEFITESAQPRQDQAGKFINSQWQSIINQNTLLTVQGAFRRQHLDYTNKDKDLETFNYTDRVWDPVLGRYVTYSYGNVGSFQLNTRDRFVLNSALSYYKDDFGGTHDFKFGGEVEYSTTIFEPGIPGGVSYSYREGQNYRKTTQVRVAQEDKSYRISAYAQDSWSPTPGLTMNLGVRLDSQDTHNEVEQLWRWTNIAPRLGFAWDIMNDGKNVFRGNYSRFYFPIIAQYNTFSVSYNTTTTYDWDAAAGEWVFRNQSGQPGGNLLDDDLTAPYTDEFSVGFEREIVRDLAVGANVIYRKTQNFVEDQEVNNTWDGLGGNTGTGEWDPSITGVDGTSNFIYELRNIGGETEYKGLELTFRKNFSNNWQMLASYVLSKAEGDVMGDYTGSSSISPEWDTPAISGDGFGPYGPNQYGAMNFDQRHVLKINGTYFFPYGINAGAAYTYQTGTPYNHYYWHDGYAGNLILYDPRGQFQYDNRHRLDLRAEKTFELPWGNLGLLVDFFNIFNDDTIVSVTESGDEDDPDSDFGRPLSLVAPRRLQLGVRFTF